MSRRLRPVVAAALVGVTALVGVGTATPVVRADAAPQFHCNQVNMHPNTLPNGQENVAYGPGNVFTLTPNSLALPLTYINVTGTLPAGLAVTAGPGQNQATLGGTPSTGSQGTYTFTVELGATYVLGTICKVSTTYTITIIP